MKLRSSIVCSILLLTFGGQAGAQDARARETLRNLTIRLRTAETERNTLLSEKAQFEQEKKALSEKVETLTQAEAKNKEELATLTTKSEEEESTLAQVKESLDKWKAAYDQIAATAQRQKAERDKFAGEAIVLKRQLADRETKNRELFRLSNEILKRYERFGMGDALAAREPFTGITKVKLENLVQDYADKISDQKVKQDGR